jgi:hypothetical protein
MLAAGLKPSASSTKPFGLRRVVQNRASRPGILTLLYRRSAEVAHHNAGCPVSDRHQTEPVRIDITGAPIVDTTVVNGCFGLHGRGAVRFRNLCAARNA